MEMMPIEMDRGLYFFLRMKLEAKHWMRVNVNEVGKTKANKNKIWEITSRRKGKLQKLLFIDGILSIKSWSLVLALGSRGVEGVKYENVQNSCQIIGYNSSRCDANKPRCLVENQLKSCMNKRITLALIVYGKLPFLWQTFSCIFCCYKAVIQNSLIFH